MTEIEVDELLKGAVDLHVHPSPSPFPRRVGAEDVARAHAQAGFRAVVMKSHHSSTVESVLSLAHAGVLPEGIDVYGGIALNGAVGGLNPRAVDLAIQMGARIVWFPTIASRNHIEHHKAHPNLKFPSADRTLMEEDPLDVFAENGALRPEVGEIIRLIADAGNVILASGHMPPDQVKAVFRAAREAGVERLLVNHPNFVLGVTHDDARELVQLGAVIEHSLCMYDDQSSFYNWPIDVLVDWIRAVGPEHSALGADLGQKNNPLPVDSYRKICGLLLKAGLSSSDVRAIVADNPARLLYGEA